MIDTSPSRPERPTESSSSRPERSEVERPLYLQSDSPPPPNFNPVARIYRLTEYLSFGPLLQRARTHFLPQLPPLHQALVLGDGDGRFLARLLAREHHLSALAVDTSATMLRLLRHHCQTDIQRVRTLQASALTIIPAPGTDLIVTHFFLDCFTQPEVDALAKTLAANTAPGTFWLLSDFAIPPSLILRPFAALYIRFLYLAFRVLTGLRVTHLPDPQSALAAADFDRIARHEFLAGFIYTEVWQRR